MKLAARIGCKYSFPQSASYIVGEWQWHTYDIDELRYYAIPHTTTNLCVMNGHMHVLFYLQSCGAMTFVYDRAIEYALLYEYYEMVKYLIENKYAVATNYILEQALRAKKSDIVAIAIMNGAHYDDHALLHFAQIGNIEMVTYLVEHGAYIHANNDAALRVSAYNGHLDIVQYLVEHGADIRAKRYYALRHGRSNVVEYLKQK